MIPYLRDTQNMTVYTVLIYNYMLMQIVHIGILYISGLDKGRRLFKPVIFETSLSIKFISPC